jgi:hypothetical protein
MTTISNITPKTRIHRGVTYVGTTTDDLNAEIVKGKSIRVFGTYCKKPFDKTFVIGDYAEYDSFNLSYYGEIVNITEKCVTIVERYGRNRHNHRLDLYTFIWRNYNFDRCVIDARNHETMQYI